MAKNPLITDEVRQVIAEVYVMHPDYRAKEVQNEVHARLRQLNAHVKPDWPGLSAIQKELTKIRKNDSERSTEAKGLDRPWSVGTVNDFIIPPEVIPTLIQIQANIRKDDGLLLTIREARWVALIYLIPTVKAVMENESLINALAKTYAIREEVSELCNTILDTSDLDDALNSGILCR